MVKRRILVTHSSFVTLYIVQNKRNAFHVETRFLEIIYEASFKEVEERIYDSRILALLFRSAFINGFILKLYASQTKVLLHLPCILIG